ncbi:unnamed protein product [Schistosoma curassoni]|uniref:Uncharacterized protein n=1 Tax=Schistosoma curassoni TaxID=6186 RepID=A0A183JXV9_9TREM|nr:unnamed protein product [Schistosoma curassoni]
MRPIKPVKCNTSPGIQESIKSRSSRHAKQRALRPIDVTLELDASR